MRVDLEPLRQMKRAEEIVSIADACLGGLRGRSALLIGPDERSRTYVSLLRQAGMRSIYQENTAVAASAILPHVQLLISLPPVAPAATILTAAAIAQGCSGQRTPLLIFDLSEATPSVEELAGLLPSVCLYTPEDLDAILSKHKVYL